MNLKILMPSETLLDQAVAKITAEGIDGAFCLLPRHVDFVSVLDKGLLSFVTPDGEEIFVAVDEGILVKQNRQVLVSTRYAVRGPQLGHLRDVLEKRFRQMDEREENARRAMAKIEAGFVRRFLEIQKAQ
jgi:F-type H+-transporting ATPase subunit epsilon